MMLLKKILFPIVLIPVIILVSSASSFAQVKTDSKIPDQETISAFRIYIPQNEIDELRRRVLATRWPDPETVDDKSQGMKLATLQALVDFWSSGYDWRKTESKLNALPNFKTTIEDLDIHFIHVRSREPNALPIIITHGWPGSILELIKLIGPLTDPVSFGGKSEDAFDVVIPSMP